MRSRAFYGVMRYSLFSTVFDTPGAVDCIFMIRPGAWKCQDFSKNLVFFYHVRFAKILRPANSRDSRVVMNENQPHIVVRLIVDSRDSKSRVHIRDSCVRRSCVLVVMVSWV